MTKGKKKVITPEVLDEVFADEGEKASVVKRTPTYITEEQLEAEVNKTTHKYKGYHFYVIGKDGKKSNRFFTVKDDRTLRPKEDDPNTTSKPYDVIAGTLKAITQSTQHKFEAVRTVNQKGEVHTRIIQTTIDSEGKAKKHPHVMPIPGNWKIVPDTE